MTCKTVEYAYLMFKDINDPAPDGWEVSGTPVWIGGNPPGNSDVGYWSILCKKIEEHTPKN